ncbi:MAG: UvrD-helicase domain-containing protein, partial [Erysipelotrichaceae bacterium]|nr:UvrD-helicase domain-containing protein [Erysipelotrichaceae bacterium]
MTVDLDRMARDKIINDIHENYFVEAGAGSGKTTVLVARMVSMVESGIDISKICAITFTKAAAAEFYERFEKALSLSENPYVKKALQDIDLCFLGTIDSFCNTVLSEHPAIAGIPSDAQNADEEERKRLIEREYLKIHRGEYGAGLAKAVNEFSASFYNHRDLFTGLISLFNGSKNLTYTIPDLEKRENELSSGKTRIMKYLSILNKHPEYLAKGKGSADSREAAETLENDFWMLLRSWEKYSGSVQTILKSLESLRIDPSSMDLLGLEWGVYFEEHQRSGKTDYFTVKKGAFISPVREYRYALAMNTAAQAASLISSVLRREGKLNFDDYLVYLRDILKQDATRGGKLIRHIRERHHYFLIDEFQDTNPIQAEIFFYLCANEVKSDWRECIPEKGTLFIVGDPKQSIYRFRNADVASYLRIREMFKGEVGEVLTLTRNFRTTDKLCSFFNEAFGALLPEDTADQSRFHAIPVGEKQPYTAEFNGVYKYHTADVTYAKDSDDPSLVASIIAKIRHNSSLTIQDRDRNGTAQPPRVPEYRDFMVITPGKPVLKRYMKEFYDRGIPFRVEGEVSFGECPSLLSMRLLLEAISDPQSPNAAYALRHFSGLKIDEEDLQSYVE